MTGADDDGAPEGGAARAGAAAAALPRKLRGIVESVERVELAGKLLMSYSPRRSARKLAAETGIGFDRAEDYVQGALLLMARSDERVTIAQRRAMLLEKARHIWRLARERMRSFQVGSRESGFEVKTAPDPDLRAMLGALEFEAQLYGVHESEADQRAIARVLEAAKACLEPHAFVALVHGIAKASGREATGAPREHALPAGSGDDDGE